MARPTLIRGVIFPGRISWPGRFSDLLAAANHKTTTAEIDAAIESIASGRAVELAPDSTMTAWTWLTLWNGYAFVRAQGFYVRRCPECQLWFLTFKKTRHTCYRLACAKAYKQANDRRRAKQSRAHEADKRQRARAGISKEASHKKVRAGTN